MDKKKLLLILLAELLDSSETDSSSESETSSSDSSDDDIMMLLASNSCETSSDEECATNTDIMETIRDYSEIDFKSHLHMNRSTVNYLIEQYMKSKGNANGNTDRELLGLHREVYVFLGYMTNSEPISYLANLFEISESEAQDVVHKVASWLRTIAHEYIRWPDSSQAEKIVTEFQRKCGIPGILGAISCSHIKIKEPAEHKEAYLNRKRYYSIHLEAVVDSELMFKHISVGEPGSMHNSRVLRRSSLYERALAEPSQVFPKDTFLIADGAYPLLNWIVPPFRNNGSLTPIQKEFNSLLSSSRMVVDNAFSMTKTRFSRLLCFDKEDDLNFVTNLVACGCILHNICIIKRDLMEYSPEEGLKGFILRTGKSKGNKLDRRDNLIEHLLLNNIL